MENTKKCIVPPIGRGNRSSPYKVNEVKDDEMGRCKKQRLPENSATAIKDMIDAEEDVTTHEERKCKDMKNNKNPKIQRKEEQKKIEEMEVESAGKAEEDNNSIGSVSQEAVEGRDRIDSNYQYSTQKGS